MDRKTNNIQDDFMTEDEYRCEEAMEEFCSVYRTEKEKMQFIANWMKQQINGGSTPKSSDRIVNYNLKNKNN